MRNANIVLILFCFSIFLYGQSEDEWSTRLLTIKKMAESREQQQKMTAVDEAERLLSENPDSSDREKALSILADLLSEGVSSVTYENGSVRNPYSSVRAAAAEVLGRYGGEESLQALVDVLSYGNDPLVMGSAAAAAVQINPHDTGRVVLAFSRILNNTRDVYNNERLIQDVLNSLELWGESRPEIFDNSDLMDGLTYCSRAYSGYGRNTRNQALKLIRTAGLKEN